MRCDSTAPFYEFFCGVGMARLGLETPWHCVFANDVDPDKGQIYAQAHGGDDLRIENVWDLTAQDLPGRALLAWASSPCQDLSMAGKRVGLDAPRSGAFWGFWRLIEDLAAQGRAPEVIVLENVTGLFSARGGRDFTAVFEAMTALGYAVGALEIDAALFVPQSRPRAFLVAARQASRALCSAGPSLPFHSAGVVSAFGRLAPAQRHHWRWWQLPTPPLRNTTLADFLDPPDLVAWHTPQETAQLLGLMAPAQRARLETLKAASEPHVGAGYRRIRTAAARKQQRFEVRFDGVAGCLRTPAGGSSRQFVVDVRDGAVRTRLMIPRETARLMGLPDDFPLPAGSTKALRMTGDGVVVPVTRWLSRMLLMPLAGLAPHPGLQSAMAE